MKKHPRFKEYMALFIAIVSFLGIPLSIWIFVEGYLEKDNHEKFRGIILSLMFAFHLVINAREYKRITKRKGSASSHTYVD